MVSVSTIEHKGIIDSISDGKVKVKFTALSACAACHAKAYCSAAEMEDKIVEVSCATKGFSPGETVSINLSLDQGYQALLIGYVYPFLLVLLSLVLLSATGVKELYAGLISLFLLFPYYLIARILQKRIDKKFQFTIHKTELQ